jgi:hypothetical protein
VGVVKVRGDLGEPGRRRGGGGGGQYVVGEVVRGCAAGGGAEGCGECAWDV